MIGIFDSGLGGLSVLRNMRQQLPAQDFLYFGDTARGPFGTRSPEMIAPCVSEGLSRLVDMGASLLVVAGHSAAACLTADIRNKFSMPVLDIITSGVVPGVSPLASRSLGIIGPPVVETAGVHKEAICKVLPETRIYSAATSLLSPLVEAGWLKKPETVMIVKKSLHFLKLRQIDTLVLGSNHYSLLSPVIQRKIGKRVVLMDAAPVLAEEVRGFLVAHPRVDDSCGREGTCRVVVSDLTGAMEKTARMFYGKNIKLERL